MEKGGNKDRMKFPECFHIWIDADSCPAPVKEHIVDISNKYSIHSIFVANRNIPLPSSDYVSMHICEQGKDVADNFIFESVDSNDIVITRDILFAERIVKRNISVMNDRGTLFTKENIAERISERNLSFTFSQLGLTNGYSKNRYGSKEKNAFCNCLDRELQKKQIL